MCLSTNTTASNNTSGISPSSSLTALEDGVILVSVLTEIFALFYNGFSILALVSNRSLAKKPFTILLIDLAVVMDS